jgi:hypothetical protein
VCQDSLALKADTQAALALKADSSALAAAQSATALKLQTQADKTSVEAHSGFVGELEASLALKASQAQLDFDGQDFQPRITAFEPLSLAPRTDTQDNPFAELSIDLDAYATTAALEASLALARRTGTRRQKWTQLQRSSPWSRAPSRAAMLSSPTGSCAL